MAPVETKPASLMPSLLLRSSSQLLRRRAFTGLTVFAGGLAGSVGREAIAWLLPAGPGGFPLDLLTVNLVGSLLLGRFLVRPRMGRAQKRHTFFFWSVGVLGSFTTFSAFSLGVVEMLHSGQAALAVSYVLVSILGGLACGELGRIWGQTR